MPEETTNKLTALPVVEVSPKIVQGFSQQEAALFLQRGGAIYYMVMVEELKKDRQQIFTMTERLFNVIRLYVRNKLGLLELSNETQIFDAIRESLYAPLSAMEQSYGGKFLQAAVEVRITTDDDDIRVHYTVRDKQGIALQRR